ncbi:hypothetical protein [Streptomyces sp. NPDC093984]|uniref:hypothetical protein n=1 Tax=Streptomyces sp. NPDC093984 TaxID=3366052 RepID=UPI0038198307
MREQEGVWDSAENLYRQAADYGSDGLSPCAGAVRAPAKLWPYALDPDGTPIRRRQ